MADSLSGYGSIRALINRLMNKNRTIQTDAHNRRRFESVNQGLGQVPHLAGEPADQADQEKGIGRLLQDVDDDGGHQEAAQETADESLPGLLWTDLLRRIWA